MTQADVPEDGEVQLDSVLLPTGRQILAERSGDPVAWATDQAIPDAGPTWFQLSRMLRNTGLVPFMLSGLHGSTERPWDTGEFTDPVDISELDRMDPGKVLESMWNNWLDPDEPEDEDIGGQEMRAPFSRRFPGLAPAVDQPLSVTAINAAVDSLPPARIGLVPASRPADVLPRIGWTGAINRYPTALPLAVVLRSWEDRFGARLLQVGFADIRLLVTRPPRSEDIAQRIAAEHYAFCDESGDGLKDVRGIAASLVDARFWDLWWD